MKNILTGLRQRAAELEAPGTERKRRRDHLEELVGERTAELKSLNWHLREQITERKRMEEALQESEEFRSHLLANSPYPMIVINPDASIRYVNPALEKLTGFTAAELMGRKPPYSWWTEETLEKTARDLEEAMRKGAVRVEEFFQRKNGERFWVEITSEPIIYNGEFKYYLARWVDITERKQAEEALQAEKNKLQSVIDAIEYSLTILDRDYNIVYLKEPAGMPSGGRVGDKCYRAYESKDKVCDGCPVEKAFRDGKSHTSERKAVAPSGEIFFLERTASPVRNAEGKIVSCLEIGRNVTERKRMEEALQVRAQMLDGATDSIFVHDFDDNFIYVNEAACRVHGYSREEFMKMNLGQVLAPEQVSSRDSIRQEMGKKGQIVFESVHLRRDGSIMPVEVHGRTIESGGRKLIFAVVRDITERKRAGEALQQSREELRKMFESVSDGIIVIDLNGVITEVNQRTVEMHGFNSKAELLGKSALDLVAPRDHEKIATNMRKTLEEGLIRGVEYTLLKADGSEFPGELSTSVLKDISGNPVGHITISRDITERKRAEEEEEWLQQELYRASRLASVGELAAGVAHEVNNPLTGILGFSQRLLRKSTDEKVNRDLERIHNEAQRAARVVQNLLAFARRREPKKAYADINDILRMTLDLRAYELKTGNIEVALDLAPDLSEVMVDLHQIQEVFLNIILNAEQAMIEAHGGGKLSIKTEEIEDYIRISFTDDGPGVPTEHLDRLFDPFFTTRGERGGTGLGLSLCHGIVAEHGGRIYARSEAGKGATFFVQLPLALQLPLVAEKIDESKVAEEKLA